MLSMTRFGGCAWMSLGVMLVAACAGQLEPAQRSIGDIEAVVTGASFESAKYVPDQLADVQSKLAGLKASYVVKDYAAVLKGAPAVMSAAQGLAGAAAAKKDEVMKALNSEWSGLAAAVPGYLGNIQGRIDLLGKKSAKKLAQGIDLDAAKANLSEASSLWSKSQAAFATGNLAEAVSTAKSMKTRLEGLESTLKMEVPTSAATPAAAPLAPPANE